MANNISQISYSNTFGNWITTTNLLANEVDGIGFGNWTKTSGSISIQAPGTGLSVSNTALFTGTVQIGTVGITQTNGSIVIPSPVTTYNVNTTTILVTGNTSLANVNTGTWQANVIAQQYGGTGYSSYANGQILIGNHTGGLSAATITQGYGINITSGDGFITITNPGILGITVQPPLLITTTSQYSALSLATSGVANATYIHPSSITVDQFGRVSSVSNTAFTTNFSYSNTSNTLDLSTSGVTAGFYGSNTQAVNIQVDAYGRIKTLSNVSIVQTDIENNTTNASYYPLFYTSATNGTLPHVYTSASNFIFNPGTGTLTATTFSASSDERLKTDIDTISNALDIVQSLRGVTFNWIDKSLGDKRNIGLIAQEVEKIIPEVVTSEKYKSVNYGSIVGILVEAIKELKAEIDDLKKSKE
jgi:hypothetical protein